ncbi:SusC/RagA family TonB-linked outer membrane protein [Lutibacter oceani]|nr:SusC/RagA family TonB-linked outer membrane protein [Lutibacter oceani]
MRTLIFLCWTTAFSLSPITLFSQDVQVNITKDKTVSIDDVFKIIKQQTDYNFIYKADMFKGYPKVNLKQGIFKTNDLLGSILEGVDFSIEFSKNNTIVIKEKMALDTIDLAQQTRKITGTITDEDGMPLPGVNIFIKDTKIGSVSDFDGNYQITFFSKIENPILVFKYIGYKSQEIVVGNQTVIEVKMLADVSELDQVVVIGYGKSKVRDLTGSITNISREGIEQGAMSSTVESVLQGRSAGVNVAIQSSSPTSPISVIIRGASSLSGDNQPLWVVDGVPQYIPRSSDLNSIDVTNNIGNTLYNLNLNDVESVNVLKDVSATAVYGSRAANGVVIVTTKKGSKSNEPIIEFSSRTGIQTQDLNGYDYFNKEEFKEFSIAAAKLRTLAYGYMINGVTQILDEQAFENLLTSEYDASDLVLNTNAFLDGNTDWIKEMTQTPINHEYGLSVKGGSEKTTYYSSFSYNDREGIVKSGGSTVIGGRFNFETNINDYLKFGMNLNGSSRDTDDKDYLFDVLKKTRPDMPGFNEDGSIFDVYEATNDINSENPYASLKNTRHAKGVSVSGTAFLDIKFLNDFTFKTAFTNNYVSSDFLVYNRRDSRGYRQYDGYRSKTDSKLSVNVWENTLDYARLIDKHDLRILAGYSMEKTRRDYFQLYLAGFPDDEILNNFGSVNGPSGFIGPPVEEIQGNALISQFARVHYKFDDRYIVSGTIRRDGSSRFGADRRWGVFPSGALAWVISSEDFMKNGNIDKYISYLKLRTSLGLTGSQNLGNYDYITSVDARTKFDGLSTLKPTNIGNADLQWEETKMFDLALDYGFLDDRIRGSFGIYEKNSRKLLFNLPIAPSSSFANIRANVGSVENKGVEFDINYDIIRNANNRLSFNFNYSKNVGKLIDLNGVDEELSLNGVGNGLIKFEVGEEMGQWFGLQTAGRLYRTAEEAIALNFAIAETGRIEPYSGFQTNAGDMYYIDQNGDNLIDNEDKVNLGSSVPKGFGGFGLTFQHKSFMVNANFTYAYGHKRYWQLAYNDYETVQPFYNQSNIIAGQSATLLSPSEALYPRMTFGGIGFRNFSDFFLYDASYLRLSALNVSYKLSNDFLKNGLIKGIDLTLQGTNLFTLTKYPGFDPQGNYSDSKIGAGMAIDFSTYPSSRIYSLGVKVKL